MDNISVKGEIFRLVSKKRALEKQEAMLKRMLDIIDKQLLGLEVEGYQLACDIRTKEDPEGDVSCSEQEIEVIDSEEQKFSEEELNKTKLDLDARLDEMLSGQFYVEESEDEETEDLTLL